MSLTNKAISGIFWTFAQQFSVQGINFIVQIVLARILLPSEFGLIAMLSVFIMIGSNLMDSGMSSSLIRTIKPDNSDYSTVFFINLAVSLIIYIILFFCAPLIADFYKEPILSLVLRVYSIAFIIRAFVAVQTTRLTKEMKFKIQMMMQIPSVIVGGIVGIVLAYMDYGVWSLVWMNLVQSFLFTVQHWIYSRWVPSLRLFSKERFSSHFNFGYKMTLSSLLNAIFNNAYNIIIGKYYSATILGFYNRSFTLVTFPSKNIASAMDKVTYPMFAAIQNNDKKLKEVYRKLMQQLMFWVVPLMVVAGVLAKPLFIFLLTAKWLPAVPYFQILCVVGVLMPLQQYNLNILKVKGRSDLFLKLQVFKKINLVIVIAIALKFGILALVISQAFNAVANYFYNSYYSGKFINYSAVDQLKDIMPILLLSSITGVVLFYLNSLFLNTLSPILALLIGSVVGMGAYLVVAHILKFSPLKDFQNLIYDKFLNKIKFFNK